MNGSVAQLVEQWTENPCVGGSIPPRTTFNLKPCSTERGFLFLDFNRIPVHDFVVFCFLRPVKSYLSLLGLLPLSLWAQFSFGVASGDPQPESVVLWTALEAVTQPQTVVWELSNEPDFTRILTSGSTTTSQDLGGTVKVIAGGLEAGQTYY